MRLKNSHTTRIICTLLLIFNTAQYLLAQQDQNPPARYRVVAVNHADSTIHSLSNEIELYLPLRIYFKLGLLYPRWSLPKSEFWIGR